MIDHRETLAAHRRAIWRCLTVTILIPNAIYVALVLISALCGFGPGGYFLIVLVPLGSLLLAPLCLIWAPVAAAIQRTRRRWPFSPWYPIALAYPLLFLAIAIYRLPSHVYWRYPVYLAMDAVVCLYPYLSFCVYWSTFTGRTRRLIPAI